MRILQPSVVKRDAHDRGQHPPGLETLTDTSIDVFGFAKFLKTLKIKPPFLFEIEKVAMLVRVADKRRKVVDVVGFDLANVRATSAGLFPDHEEAPFQQLQVSLKAGLVKFDHDSSPSMSSWVRNRAFQGFLRSRVYMERPESVFVEKSVGRSTEFPKQILRRSPFNS